MNTQAHEVEFATAIVINNPFDPKDAQNIQVLIEGDTIADLMPDNCGEYIVCVNGHIVEDLDKRLVQPNDFMVFSPVPQGGDGGGKSVLRVAALIAVSAFTYGTGAGTLSSLVGTKALEGFAGMALQGVAFAAGSMLINAVMPLEQNLPTPAQTMESSPSYGIDGPKNTSEEGLAVPVVYGNYRVAGNLIDNVVFNQADQVQELIMRFAISEGPINSVPFDGVQINDRPISDFIGEGTQKPEIIFTQGNVNESVNPWFAGSSQSNSVSTDLTTSYTTYTTSEPIDRFRIDVVTPQGFREITNDRGSIPLLRDITVEYRKVGDPGWTELLSDSLSTEYTKTYVYTHTWMGGKYTTPETDSSLRSWGTEQPDGRIVHTRSIKIDKHTNRLVTFTCGYVLKEKPAPNQSIQIYGMYTNPARFSFESPLLDSGTYEIRVKRDTAESGSDSVLDKISWSDVVEFQSELVGYANTATASIRIKLNEQLNSLPKVTFLTSGREVRVWQLEEEGGVENTAVELTNYRVENLPSDNPAWIAIDILTNARYGGRIPDSQIDLEKFIEWANFCGENDLTFNGVFDQGMSIWDALQHVLTAGHAQIINIGTRFSVVIEQPEVPTMLFSVANIIKETFSTNWLPVSDRANEIEATYFDKDDNYLQNTLRITDSDVPGSISDQRKAEITLYGVTDKDRAAKDAQKLLSMNKYILATVSFEAAIEAITCTIGDVVYVQHDVPQWGFAGRLDANSATASTGFVLDKEVEVEAGVTYELLVCHDSVLKGSFTVDSIVAGNYVRLNPADYPAGNLSRAIIDGTEYKVINTFSDTLGEGIVVDGTVPGGAVGEACDIYESDVIESRQLTSVTLGGPGTYTTLDVDSAFSGIGQRYSKWMFGPVNQTKKPFRIQSISGGTEHTRHITAMEYNENIYLDSPGFIPSPNYSQINRYIAQVSNLAAEVRVIVLGNVYQPVVDLSWDHDDSRYRGADISVRRANGQWETIGSTSNTEKTFSYKNASFNETLEFRAVAYDSVAKRASVAGAPTITKVMAANFSTVPPASGLTAVFRGSNISLSWTNPDFPAYKKTQVFRGSVNDFNDAGTVRIHSTDGEAYIDTSAPEGTASYYWVVVVNTDEVSSDENQASGTQPATPTAPANLRESTAFVGSRAFIAWNADNKAAEYEVEVVTNSVSRRTEIVSATSFSYGIEEMEEDGHTNRSVTFNVKTVDHFGRKSSASSITATNNAPALPTGLSVTGGFRIVRIEFNIPVDTDYKNTKIWKSATTGFTPNDTNLIGETYGGPVNDTNVDDSETYYYRIQTFDTFGGGTMSTELAATTTAAITNKIATNSYSADDLADAYIASHKASDLIFEVSNGTGDLNWPTTFGGVHTLWFESDRAKQIFYNANGGANEEWVRTTNPSTYPNWTAWRRQEVYSSSDVDALLTNNGPAEAGATNGADWDGNLTNRPPNTQLYNNLLNTDGWSSIAADGAIPGFAPIGTDPQAEHVTDVGPFGDNEVVWAGNHDSSGATRDVGFICDPTPVDPGKIYRFSCWIYCTGQFADADFSFGYETTESAIADVETGNIFNPPGLGIVGSANIPALDKWYLLVWYLLPYDYAHNSGIQDRNGLYDPETGKIVWSSPHDQRFANSGVTEAQPKFYTSGDNTANRTRFARPRFEVVNGNEFPLDQLMGSISGRNMRAEAVYVGGDTFETNGIQLEDNSGSPRMYMGDGSDNYIKMENGVLSLGPKTTLGSNVDRTVTVGSGEDYATINLALEALSRTLPAYKNEGFQAKIVVESGYTANESIYIDGVDLSWITIESADGNAGVVNVPNAYTGGKDWFTVANGGNSPIINFSVAVASGGSAINSLFKAELGSTLTFKKRELADVRISLTLGEVGATSKHVHVTESSTALCERIRLYGDSASTLGQGFWAEKSSQIQAGDSFIYDMDTGIYVKERSHVGAVNCRLNDIGYTGIYASEDSTATVGLTQLLGSKPSYGIWAVRGSTVISPNGTFTGCGTNGARAEGGSLINLEGGNYRKGGSNSSTDIVAYTGSTITTSSTTGGTIITKNTLAANGIIYG